MAPRVRIPDLDPSTLSVAITLTLVNSLLHQPYLALIVISDILTSDYRFPELYYLLALNLPLATSLSYHQAKAK